MRRNDTVQKVWAHIKESYDRGSLPTCSELCDRFGFARPTAHHHRATLAKAGLVRNRWPIALTERGLATSASHDVTQYVGR